MAQQRTNYKVFISSPNDVCKLRQVAKETIASLSSSYERKGISLSSFAWETDSFSDFGATPQTIITRQLGDYDIYIGIMGARFGSPTENYGSGTEEEFFNALKSYETVHTPKLGFFFKSEVFKMSDLSPETLDQLQKVLAFKNRIGPLGLYHEFSEDHELVRHIHSLVLNAIETFGPDGAVVSYQHSLYVPPASREPAISKFFMNESLNAIDENISVGEAKATLEDIWIEPELTRPSDDGSEGPNLGKLYKFDELVRDLSAKQSIILVGGDTSGKSSVCRRAFIDLFRQGLFPVLLDGKTINNPDSFRLDQRIKIAYDHQYQNLRLNSFGENDRHKSVAIVDDYDLAKLNKKNSSKVLLSMIESLHAVLISVSPTFTFDLLEQSSEVSGLSVLQRVEIRDLGQKKRYRLIEKWCSLSGHLDEAGLRTLVEERRKVINRVLTSNLVPRTPMIVLILLKAIDVGQVGDLAKNGYVRYYKFLIDSAIMKNVSKEDAEGAYALLPELAWTMHLNNTRELSPDDAERVIEEFSKRRALRKTFFYSVLASLRRIGMFDPDISGHKFKYGYAYYFFLADHIRQNMNDPTMRATVTKLCHEISVKESATILVFLAFHSEDSLIVDTLIAGLQTASSSSKQFEFSNSRTAPINKLIFEAPRQIIEYDAAKERREARLEEEDADEQYKLEQETDKVEDGPLSNMRRIFTAIEILGHIMRNHYARLDAEPKRLIFDASTKATLLCVGEFSITCQSQSRV